MTTAAVNSLRIPAFMRLHWINAFTRSPGRLLGDPVWKGYRAC